MSVFVAGVEPFGLRGESKSVSEPSDHSEIVPKRPRLSKTERRRLLAEIEQRARPRSTSDVEATRIRQALELGELERARRLLRGLADRNPRPAILSDLEGELVDAEEQAKKRANLRAAEEMLERYIQQRKKQLAEFALETLTELAPAHPRLADYRTWVADIDQEVRMQSRLDDELTAGRVALRASDLASARKRLDTLRKLDPHSVATEVFSAEIERAEAERQEGATIEERKRRIEQLLEAGDVNAAEEEVDALAELDVSKVSLDFLRRRLDRTRESLRSEAELLSLQSVFEQHVSNQGWQAARDVATTVGQLFPDHPLAGEMFNRVNRLENSYRRKQSIEQGKATLEGFIQAGQRAQAELTLKVLRGLVIDEHEMAHYRARIERM